MLFFARGGRRYRFPLTHLGLSYRTHLTHASPPTGSASQQLLVSGPRTWGVELGLPAAQSTANLLRLLESASSMQAKAVDVCSTLWHPQGKFWHLDQQQNASWIATSIVEQTTTFPPNSSSNDQTEKEGGPRRLLSLEFSDERTALAQLVDQEKSYILSLFKLNDASKESQSLSFVPHDGWTIVRQVTTNRRKSALEEKNNSLYASLEGRLQDYLNIEHGGGVDDAEKAKSLFHPDASLLTVGMEDPETCDSSSLWSAPVGQFLEISLSTYLEGVATQEPHDNEARQYDEIVQITPINSSTAVATVRVGNGAKTCLFCDFLLLGRGGGGDWQILSKIFSPQPWGA